MVVDGTAVFFLLPEKRSDSPEAIKHLNSFLALLSAALNAQFGG